MPFKSKAQRRYLFAKHPEVAREFAGKMKSSHHTRLPEHTKYWKQQMKKSKKK